MRGEKKAQSHFKQIWTVGEKLNSMVKHFRIHQFQGH